MLQTTTPQIRASQVQPEYDGFARGGNFLMKLLTLVLLACLFAVAAPQAICHDNKLHLTEFLPETNPGRLVVSNAYRDVSDNGERILHLRGDVEVRMITCAPNSKGVSVCDRGSMVMHADSVDFNEKTGELQATGNVHVVPYPNHPRKTKT
jgi:lipopolysaccharide assembly outer membrane protein LptD (OstA)